MFSFLKTKLEGSLKIEGFKNLESIRLKNVKLDNLKISDCSQLKKVDLFEFTKLTSLSVNKCSNLTAHNCSLNGLSSLNSLKIRRGFMSPLFSRKSCQSLGRLF
jgi:Leucine-rich repeat (LRR) protein